MKAILRTATVLTLALVAGISLAQTNDLTPAGPPGSPETWMKNLNQVEPRTLISTLPITITNRGSYYLTGNLYGIDGTNGITIRASNVDLDLKGFAIVGTSNALHGVMVPQPWAGDPATYGNISIHNGVVCNWGRNGIALESASDGKVYDIIATSNGFANMGAGIGLGQNWRVTDCGAFNNAGDGFYIPSANCTVRGCVARFNGGHGFRAGYASLIQNCYAYGNTTTGIITYGQTSVRDCIVIDSIFGDGIAVDDNCRVEGNHVLSCGNGTGVHGAGIHVKNGSRVVDNYVIQNAIGIKVQDGGNGNLFIRNSARANNETNYMITPNNMWGIVITNSPESSTISNQSPWLNFVH